jgi:hypothetical protein
MARIVAPALQVEKVKSAILEKRDEVTCPCALGLVEELRVSVASSSRLARVRLLVWTWPRSGSICRQ